jgi:hypothetical protein
MRVTNAVTSRRWYAATTWLNSRNGIRRRRDNRGAAWRRVKSGGGNIGVTGVRGNDRK